MRCRLAASLIVSIFIPSVGSMVCGDTGIGVAILAVWIIGVILSFALIGLLLA